MGRITYTLVSLFLSLPSIYLLTASSEDSQFLPILYASNLPFSISRFKYFAEQGVFFASSDKGKYFSRFLEADVSVLR